MQTIYVDVLIVLNIYVNYFLLKTTAKITHSGMKNIRCIAASVYGSIYSLMILLPKLNTAVSILIKLAAAVTIVFAAFGLKCGFRLFINTVTFFAANFIFAGTIYAAYTWFKPNFIHFNNTYFYIDFSLIILVCTTAVLYLAVCIIRTLIDRIPDESDCYKIIIRYKDKIVSLSGLADTGNSLVDFFSGSPVIICGKDKLKALTGIENISDCTDFIPKGFRLIPCSTISDSGLIPVFRPDEIVIFNGKSGMKKSVEAMVGIGTNSQDAIFNPKLLKL